METEQTIDSILETVKEVRYVAVYSGGNLRMRSRANLDDASSYESDKYEELLVNPALITLAKQRGEIDCGGFKYLLVRYGHFHQLVVPLAGGHVSVAIREDVDPMPVVDRVVKLVFSQE